jgi:CheY-like chemotaxis protein
LTRIHVRGTERQSVQRVLVVDDHPINRLVMTEVFTHLGCAVSVAENGAQALAAAEVEHFDLICLDRQMPGMLGDEVLSHLAADQFVLAWSTDTSNLPARFNGVLCKPVTVAAVQVALARTLAWRISVLTRDLPQLRRAVAA